MPTTWEPGSVVAVTLSGGNLTATSTGTTSANQGAHGLVTDAQTAGKYYFELLFQTSTAGINRGVGIGTTASTYTGMSGSATTGVIAYFTGSIWANGSQAIATVGGLAAGQTVGIAIDLDARRFWVHVTPSGNWNNSGTPNPATGVGGVAIPAGTMVPFVVFGGVSGVAGNVYVANFGASAFNGAVPSGFIAGFPTPGAAAVASEQARVMVLA